MRQQDVTDFMSDYQAEQQAAALAALDGEIANPVVERPDPPGAYLFRSRRKTENTFAGPAEAFGRLANDVHNESTFAGREAGADPHKRNAQLAVDPRSFLLR